jgi:hypothetical protein
VPFRPIRAGLVEQTRAASFQNAFGPMNLTASAVPDFHDPRATLAFDTEHV